MDFRGVPCRCLPADAGPRAANAEEAARQTALALPVIKPLYEQGLSLRAIARELVARGVPTARCGQWTAVQVSDILRRGAKQRPTGGLEFGRGRFNGICPPADNMVRRVAVNVADANSGTFTAIWHGGMPSASTTRA